MEIFPPFILYHIDNHCVNIIISFRFYPKQDTKIANSFPYSNNVLCLYDCKNIGNSIVNRTKYPLKPLALGDISI